MPEAKKYSVAVTAHSTYLPDQSDEEEDRYVFAYTIRITNNGSVPAQLVSRHWIITDAENQVQEVRGMGVVGEQPTLKPGDTFEYSSGSSIPTAVGTMRGSYQMVAEDGTRFEAPIPGVHAERAARPALSARAHFGFFGSVHHTIATAIASADDDFQEHPTHLASPRDAACAAPHYTRRDAAPPRRRSPSRSSPAPAPRAPPPKSVAPRPSRSICPPAEKPVCPAPRRRRPRRRRRPTSTTAAGCSPPRGSTCPTGAASRCANRSRRSCAAARCSRSRTRGRACAPARPRCSPARPSATSPRSSSSTSIRTRCSTPTTPPPGMVTGYYEPLLRGSRMRIARYRYPLYAVPQDMLTIDLSSVYPDLKHRRLRGRVEGNKVVPYLARGDIDREPAPLKGLELVWVDDAVDAFFLHIQGSGQVELENGERMRVGYADQNGHPFRSLGRPADPARRAARRSAPRCRASRTGRGAIRRSCRSS